MISKKLKDEKIVGYIILLAGLIIMFYSIFSVITVFLSGQVPIEIIKTEQDNANLNGGTNESNGSNGQSHGIDFGDIMKPLFPIFNAMVWLSIAFFILAAGGRVAIIGIKTMKASLHDINIVGTEKIKNIDKKKK